jgi:hypothetical protein
MYPCLPWPGGATGGRACRGDVVGARSNGEGLQLGLDERAVRAASTRRIWRTARQGL